jgi:ribonuclease P protein component
VLRENLLDGEIGASGLTLRKENKLKTKSDFDYVRENGRRYTDSFYTLLAVSGSFPEAPYLRFGVICSRRFHRNAVVRNRARRLVSESVRLLQRRIKPCRIIVIPRRAICRATMPEVRTRIERTLKSAGCLETFPK